jgi:hypothetical protein
MYGPVQGQSAMDPGRSMVRVRWGRPRQPVRSCYELADWQADRLQAHGWLACKQTWLPSPLLLHATGLHASIHVCLLDVHGMAGSVLSLSTPSA